MVDILARDRVIGAFEEGGESLKFFLPLSYLTILKPPWSIEELEGEEDPITTTGEVAGIDEEEADKVEVGEDSESAEEGTESGLISVEEDDSSIIEAAGGIGEGGVEGVEFSTFAKEVEG